MCQSMSQRGHNNDRRGGEMSKRVGLEASHAVAEAVKMADVDVIAA